MIPFDEIFVSALKLLIFFKLVNSTGWIYSIILYFLILRLYNLFMLKTFKLEKMSANDKNFIGWNPQDKINLMAVFLFEENKFDKERLKDLLIEKLISKVQHFRHRIVKKYYNWYWKEEALEDAIKTIKFMEDQVSENGESLRLFMEKEINKHIDIFSTFPYEVYIIPFSKSNGGAMIIKFDHCFSDGLSFLSTVCLFADNFSENLFLPIMRSKPSLWWEPLWELLSFPIYGPMVFYQGIFKSKGNTPLRNDKDSCGKTKIAMSRIYDLKSFDEVRKEFNLSFNELMINIISVTCNRLIKESSDKEVKNAKFIRALVPIGNKGIVSDFKYLKVTNQSQAFNVDIPLLSTLDKEGCSKIKKELRNIISNVGVSNAAINISKVFHEFMPISVITYLAKIMLKNLDLMTSNMPGPISHLYFGDMKVTELYPISSAGNAKSFLPIMSYSKKFRIIYSMDEALGLEPGYVIKVIEELLSTIESTKKNE
jgi:hypothetical protein